jgi:hypothetical protein
MICNNASRMGHAKKKKKKHALNGDPMFVEAIGSNREMT